MQELIAPSINLAILIGVLVYFLRTPVREMIRKRHFLVLKQVQESQDLKALSEKKFSEFNAKLNAFENEAQQILEKSKSDAAYVKDKIIKDAYATAERIIKDAEATVQANLQDYKDQIKKETIHRAVEIAEKIIREKVSDDDQRRIVTEYVGKVQ